MDSLPIARREMLVLAKSPAIYRGRLGISIFLLLAGTAIGTIYHFAGIRMAGQFMPMAGFILLIYCLFSGAQATADSISREKREGTLGLLFLTHMRSGQILFGKLFSNTLLVFYGLLTAFPLASIMLIMGGVDGAGLVKMFVGAINVLFFSASIGLFCSTLGWDRKRTTACATWILLFFWFVPGNLAEFLRIKGYTGWSTLLLFMSPGHVFAFSIPFPGAARFGSYWFSLLGSHAIGWMFLLGAWYFLPRKWQEKAASAGKRTWRERWQQFCYGGSNVREKRRHAFLNVNPFYWLSARDRLRPVSIWLFFGFFLCLFGWIFWLTKWEPGMFLAFTILLTILQKFTVGGAATTRLNEEHEQGTLELLLSTPITVRDLVRGQALAILWQFRGPWLVLLVMQSFAFIMLVFTDHFGIGEGERVLTGIFAMAFLALNYLDLFTLTRMGLWGSVSAKQPKQAPGVAIGVCIIFPALVFGVIMVLTGATVWYFELQFEPQPWQMMTLYLSIAFANNIYWLRRFEREFPRRLREFASRRYVREEKPTIIERLARLRLFRARPAAPPLLSSRTS